MNREQWRQQPLLVLKQTREVEISKPNCERYMNSPFCSSVTTQILLLGGHLHRTLDHTSSSLDAIWQVDDIHLS